MTFYRQSPGWGKLYNLLIHVIATPNVRLKVRCGALSPSRYSWLATNYIHACLAGLSTTSTTLLYHTVELLALIGERPARTTVPTPNPSVFCSHLAG